MAEKKSKPERSRGQRVEPASPPLARPAREEPTKRERAPRAFRQDVFPDGQCVAAWGFLYTYLGDAIKRVVDAKASAALSGNAHWLSLGFDRTADFLWPGGKDGFLYRNDKPLLAAAKAYLAAERDLQLDEQGGLARFIAWSAWQVVLGRQTPIGACEGVKTSANAHGCHMHEGAHPDGVKLAAKKNRADTSPLVRAFRVYNVLARDLPVAVRADKRGAPRGALKELLVSAGAREGDQACRAEVAAHQRRQMARLLGNKRDQLNAIAQRKPGRKSVLIRDVAKQIGTMEAQLEGED